jgi:restriction endonuclease Mrr
VQNTEEHGSMNAWEVAILKTYDHLDGCAKNRAIYDNVGKFIRLSQEHMRATVYGGRPAYEHQVRSHITNLYQAGHLQQLSRGYYCLTTKGKKRIIPAS